jgi:3-hexulose-6-phosphate synthase/6-phospho-3-hexuloisomerase
MERDEKLLEGFKSLSTALICDAMGKRCYLMDSAIKPLIPGLSAVGYALTVKNRLGDWQSAIRAIDQARPGDFLVLDAHINPDLACWGGLNSYASKLKGVVGAVVDGAARDLQEIKELGFPVYAKRIVPRDGAGEGCERSEIGIPVNCGGVNVKPGDIIFGDDDGVVVVPIEEAETILEKALAVKEIEEDIRENLSKGMPYQEAIRRADEEAKKKGIAIL